MQENISLAQKLRAQVETNPQQTVFWNYSSDGRETTYTWAELDRRSSQVAAALAERGLGVGDRLGVGLHSPPLLIFSVLAAWKLGAVPIPMRWDLPEWEFERLSEVVDGLCLGAQDMDWLNATSDNESPEFPDVVSPYISGICSGGSTGLPKVILSNRPGVFDAQRLATPFPVAWGMSIPRPQRIIVLGPMYHIVGFQGIYTLLAGDPLFVLEKFDAALAVDVIERHRISAFNCTPTMLKRMADLDDIGQRDLSSIRWFLQGAAPMPPYLVHRWIELIGAEKVFLAYGMSEGLGYASIRGDEYVTHEGSVGRPFGDTEVRILDADGRDLPAGEVGEVYMRSSASLGSIYLGKVEPLPSTEDGFRSVGDIGYVDEDGYLYLIDRRSDLIITGGANVYPAEVEFALVDHPKIGDIVVIGLQDDKWGRRVHAIIEPANADEPPSFDEIRDYAKKRIASYKVPKSIEIVETIPRSEATKVNRRALVEERGG